MVNKDYHCRRCRSSLRYRNRRGLRRSL